MRIRRSIHFETLAKLGNGCELKSYWPEHRAYPLVYAMQGGSAAPLKPDQLPLLRNALTELLEDNPALAALGVRSDTTEGSGDDA